MKQTDVYYRALLEYKKVTSTDGSLGSLRSAIAESDLERDKIVVTRAFCTIDEDWVNEIEKGLEYIDKAIKEDRQFIRSNGEVVPIEKVKHVSRESVEHLAKHSNLITRYEEDEDIIPDKLYTVERLSDYAVYENRFLYMLLCYLRDFVTLRYNDILDISHKYDATVNFDKSVTVGKQSLSYTVSMHDVRRDDPYLSYHNPARETIERISLVLKAILAFLSTPLMESVAKVPMIKPPITKTNVLKMDNNFKGAVALYDYIIAYRGPGYTVKTEVKSIAPFRGDMADELAEVGGLVSFIAYEYGLGMKQELKASYLEYEEEQKKEEIKKRAERIAALKRRLEKAEISPEEYAVTLERQVRDLEGEVKKAEEMTALLEAYKESERHHSDKIELLNKEMAEERHAHYEEMERLKHAHEDSLHDLIVENEKARDAMRERYEAEIEKVNDEARESEARHKSELDSVRETAMSQMTALSEQCKAEVERMSAEALTHRTEYERIKGEFDGILEEKRLAEARVKALGGVDRDYTDRASFNELEREYNAFTRVYKAQWAKAKKRIRKERLSIENLKRKEESDESSD